MVAKLFYGLFFLVPLVLWPFSSEVFEFNKMIVVYVTTTLILVAWLSRCVVAKKFIFRRTTLDIPILLFLAALTLSTVFSIDIRTSILGYYSRFHGGLLSYVSYTLLYWAFVSNMDAKKTLTTCYFLLASGFLVSVYGVLQHFGIDKNVWVQDVANRIFSTLGQPNWLAAWIVALVPLTWALWLKARHKILDTRYWLWAALSALFFVVLLFTKSRSGLLGFLVADAIFWTFSLLREKGEALSSFVICHLSFVILAIAIGTPFTNKPIVAPETGGTESGQIRKIVWKGTVNLWKKYPVLGTGPETFAYSYWETRPVEHNLVSEWDFLYNKAHNEYLNFAATTGTLGLIAYLILISFSIVQIFTSKSELRNALLAGYLSILTTNFFGFSVVPVALLFFMFPAMAVSLTAEHSTEYIVHRRDKLNNQRKLFIFFVLCAMSYVLFAIGKYWYSDYLYAKGRLYNEAENYKVARPYLVKAVRFSPKEAIFWSELSRATASLSDKPETAKIAVDEAQKAVSFSPRNLNLQRNLASVLIKLAAFNPDYLEKAKEVTESAIVYAPTDAKLYYNLALTTYRLGEKEEALRIFDKTIDLKTNYKNARFGKALVLIELGRRKEAKMELAYILEKIDPNDTLAREELEKL